MTEWQNVKTSELVRIVAIEDRAASTMAMLMRSEAAAELDRRFPVQPAAPVSGWQPIRTAPRDGTLVVVAVDGYPEFARWNRQKDYWDTAIRFVNPTHWMPLPEVPK